MKNVLKTAVLTGLLAVPCVLAAQDKTVKIRMIETSDVHAAFFAEDAPGTTNPTSLTRVSAYVNQQRQEMGENHVVLLENGDILQGRPGVYYLNFADDDQQHDVAEMMNYMRYDVANMGNHDVETSHSVYDRWSQQVNCPVLGANMVDTRTNKPYFKPYTILEKDGIKIAVLGAITETVPSWLAESMWSNIQFQDLIECAQQWVPLIREQEKPDLVVGLFHSGKEGGVLGADGTPHENRTLAAAQQVPGLDIIFFGHDHMVCNEQVQNPLGETVYLLDPANQCANIAQADIEFTVKNGKVVDKKITPAIVNLKNAAVDEAMEKAFEGTKQEIIAYNNRKIGTFTETVESKNAFIGPTAFISLIHDLQLAITGAQISLTAPLSMNSVVNKGDVTVQDMFKLYRFENYLYTMRLTGKELKGLLEMSYGNWVNTMKSADDDLFLLDKRNTSDEKSGFKGMYFNFDQAQGINYTVDVTKPVGERLNITTLADGTPFDLNKEYTVAINSYRANGGGDLITLGAGIPKEELNSRIIFATDRDLRYYLMQHIEKMKVITPKVTNNWKFIPEEWTVPAGERNMKQLFK